MFAFLIALGPDHSSDSSLLRHPRKSVAPRHAGTRKSNAGWLRPDDKMAA